VSERVSREEFEKSVPICQYCGRVYERAVYTAKAGWHCGCRVSRVSRVPYDMLDKANIPPADPNAWAPGSIERERWGTKKTVSVGGLRRER
jgi:hypothetical protein